MSYIIMFKLNPPKYYGLAKEGFWIILGQIATVLGAVMLVRVLTEYLDPSQYGELALGLTVAGLVNQLVMGGVTNGIGRYYPIASEKQDLYGYFRASNLLMIYATMVVAIIGLTLMLGLLWTGASEWLDLAIIALIYAILIGYNSAFSGIQNAARQRGVVAFHSGLDAWLKILLAIAVLHWLGTSSTSVVIGYTLSSLLVAGSQFIILRGLIPSHKTSVRHNSQWAQQILKYSWPYSTWGIFTWLQQSSDRWALQAFTTTEEVGLYAVLFQLGYIPISLIIGMVISFLGPILNQRAGDATDLARTANVHQLAWRITFSCLLLTLIGFLIAYILHSWFFQLLVAHEYQAVSYLLPWVVMAGGLFASGQMLAVKLSSELRVADMLRAKIVTALMGVLFNYFGALIAGLRGIIIALLLFSAAYLVWMALLAFRNPIEINSTSDTK